MEEGELVDCTKMTEDAQTEDFRGTDLKICGILIRIEEGSAYMPESTNKEDGYQPIAFDAIKIGLASPEKIIGVVSRGGNQAGNHQLQNLET